VSLHAAMFQVKHCDSLQYQAGIQYHILPLMSNTGIYR